MSEILDRAVFETCLHDQTEAPSEEEVRKLLAHDAALRLALAEAEGLITEWGVTGANLLARAESAEARLAEATRVMLALADERDPDVLTVMSTLLRAAGNTPQADLCALLAREVPR